MKNGIAWCLIASVFFGCDGGQADYEGLSSPPLHKVIEGESFTLVRSEAKTLSFDAAEVLRVYGIDSAGQEIEYDTADYVLEGNAISRTVNSSIPDFANYSVVLDADGFFSFDSSSPRNPPETLPFLVYVRYATTDCNGQVDAKSLLSDRNDDGIHVVYTAGDSITAGAHTTSQYYRGTDDDSFSGLLRTYLASAYGRSTVVNMSGDAATLGLFAARYRDTLYGTGDRPPADMVIISYGMNDHTNPNSSALESFKNQLSSAIRELINNQVQVVVVGFFQQNNLWNAEIVEQTVSYNQALSQVAVDQGVPFVDIYAAFESFERKGKSVVHDLTGDGLHHPNDFGHQIYFSEILPYVLSATVNSENIDSYVCRP